MKSFLGKVSKGKDPIRRSGRASRGVSGKMKENVTEVSVGLPVNDPV